MRRLWWRLLILVATGCGARPAEVDTPRDPADAAFPCAITDSFDTTLTLPQRPLRIVSTAPANTEVLFAIGAGPQIVGVTTYCDYPPAASQCGTIGGFAPDTISQERIVGLKPDLVLTTGNIQRPLTESLRKLGLAVLCFDAQNLTDVIANVRTLGKATGHGEAAEAFADSLDQRRHAVKERLASSKAARPDVMFLIFEEPLMVAGPTTFAGQIIELAGGRNVFADVKEQFPVISDETIVKRDPTYILVGEKGDFAARKQRLRTRPGWQTLSAVKNDRVLVVDEDLLYRPGPRLLDGLETLTKMLHP